MPDEEEIIDIDENDIVPGEDEGDVSLFFDDTGDGDGDLGPSFLSETKDGEQ